MFAAPAIRSNPRVANCANVAIVNVDDAGMKTTSIRNISVLLSLLLIVSMYLPSGHVATRQIHRQTRILTFSLCPRHKE